MRERVHGLVSQIANGRDRVHSDSDSNSNTELALALDKIERLVKEHSGEEELYPMMVGVLDHYGRLLERDVGM